ncbi:Nucleoside-binding protein [uncultured Eubacteriales bacterium]|uniref:Nucleoside-binding protein n=1 Tax=uncultured Eubacteriales bacterium TaxID=172733 RepID=A0A212JPP1_9FIRM|nr:Nucleoside-binding protein [uncultured Eubacteriales bacterium]
MKRILTLALAFVLACSLAACGGETKPTGTPAGTPAGTPSGGAESLKVTFITTAGGLGDRSFNDSTWVGVQRAGEELGVSVSLIEPATVADFGSSIVAAANSGANVIIGIGASWTDAFDEYCEKYPDIYFCGLNASASADNLMMARTADHEGSFLVGALAAMMSKTGTIGAVGGMDGDNINRFLIGYAEGAAYVNPDIKVLQSYVGSFSDPAKGKEFALQLMNEGADIIYQVAGGTGEGVFEAAKENENLYAIGVDADQDYIVEGKILTSMMKNCDVVAYTFIERILNGEFTSGDVVFDLDNNGVGLSPMTYTKDLIGEGNLKTLEEIREKIISGEIKVTDLFAQ